MEVGTAFDEDLDQEITAVVLLRLGPEGGARALEEMRVQPFDMAPRPMPGWVTIDRADLDDDELIDWLEQARAFVETLPPK